MPKVATQVLVDLYRRGETSAAIGKAVGMPASTVRARLSYAGVVFTGGKGGRPRKLVAAVTAVLDEIAEMKGSQT